MKRNLIVVKFVVDRRAAKLILAVAALGAFALVVSSETLTLSTSYPAPVGVYNQIVTTGNAGAVAADTTLARNAGNVVLVPATNVNGRVGIGLTAPLTKFDVAGTMRAGGMVSDPAGSPEGAFYYNTVSKKMRIQAGSWMEMGGSPQGGFCGYSPTSGGGSSFPCSGRPLDSGCPDGFTLLALGTGITCVKN